MLDPPIIQNGSQRLLDFIRRFQGVVIRGDVLSEIVAGRPFVQQFRRRCQLRSVIFAGQRWISSRNERDFPASRCCSVNTSSVWTIRPDRDARRLCASRTDARNGSQHPVVMLPPELQDGIGFPHLPGARISRVSGSGLSSIGGVRVQGHGS